MGRTSKRSLTTLGKFLKRTFEEHDCSANYFAGLCGWGGSSTLSEAMTGAHEPSVSSLEAIAQGYQKLTGVPITLDQLKNGIKPSKPTPKEIKTIAKEKKYDDTLVEVLRCLTRSFVLINTINMGNSMCCRFRDYVADIMRSGKLNTLSPDELRRLINQHCPSPEDRELIYMVLCGIAMPSPDDVPILIYTLNMMLGRTPENQISPVEAAQILGQKCDETADYRVRVGR